MISFKNKTKLSGVRDKEAHIGEAKEDSKKEDSEKMAALVAMIDLVLVKDHRTEN